MRVIFLSDVHLNHLADHGYGSCIAFLERLRGRDMKSADSGDAGTIFADHLVIAGDFFDFWFERRGRIYPAFQPVVERLVRLSQYGIRVTLCEGNHDFFLSDYFSSKSGIEVHSEAMEIDLDGIRTFVSHGDTVDTDNRRYLALRGFLRSSFAYRLQQLLPLSFLWRIARISSSLSQEISPASQERLVKAMHRFALQRYREGVDAVILGHSHQAMLQHECIDGKPRTLALLGDWINHHSYLAYEDGCFTLNRFALGG